VRQAYEFLSQCIRQPHYHRHPQSEREPSKYQSYYYDIKSKDDYFDESSARVYAAKDYDALVDTDTMFPDDGLLETLGCCLVDQDLSTTPKFLRQTIAYLAQLCISNALADVDRLPGLEIQSNQGIRHPH